jgi:menaquinone-dependent protoporphyrinogen oxidase
MQILVVYGSNEGQTEKITRFVAEHLERQGHQVVTANTSETPALPDPRRFEAVLVAASVHLGRYQAPVVRFVREQRAAISARTNAFLSVSLAAAGHAADDVAGLEKCIAAFVQASGWTPQRVHHVAGALRYTAYSLPIRYVMKYIAWRKGGPTDTHRDYELTDWADVARFADTFVSAETVGRA